MLVAGPGPLGLTTEPLRDESSRRNRCSIYYAESLRAIICFMEYLSKAFTSRSLLVLDDVRALPASAYEEPFGRFTLGS